MFGATDRRLCTLVLYTFPSFPLFGTRSFSSCCCCRCCCLLLPFRVWGEKTLIIIRQCAYIIIVIIVRFLLSVQTQSSRSSYYVHIEASFHSSFLYWTINVLLRAPKRAGVIFVNSSLCSSWFFDVCFLIDVVVVVVFFFFRFRRRFAVSYSVLCVLCVLACNAFCRPSYVVVVVSL